PDAHGKAVAVAFSPDGALLAWGHEDGTVMLWVVGPDAPQPVAARTTQGQKIDFPAGERSWANRVVSFKPGAPAPKRAWRTMGAGRRRTPRAARGPPDFTGADDREDERHYVSLGDGGELILEFTDHFLIDGDGPDLAIFEIGPEVEPMNVAVSEDGETWIDV